MARTELERIVQPSLLDRLTDLAPRTPADPPPSREDSERQYKKGLERDVEFLLNTRRTMEPAPDEFPELRNSVYEFGLPDTTGVPVATKTGRERLVTQMQEALERFEPRLAEPKVRMAEADQVRSPQVRFVVEAMMVMDRDRQSVVFDTVLEVARGEYEVHAGDPGAGSG